MTCCRRRSWVTHQVFDGLPTSLGNQGSLRLPVHVSDYDNLALQLRILAEFLQNRSLGIGVSGKNVQEHVLQLWTLGNVPKYMTTQILMGGRRMLDSLKDGADDLIIVQGNNGYPCFVARGLFFLQSALFRPLNTLLNAL